MFTGPGEIKRRAEVLDPQKSQGEMKSREMELASPDRMGCLAAELFLNSYFSDTVFVSLSLRGRYPTLSLVRRP